MLPWVKKLGKYEIPDFDFKVKGVTSISADVHKVQSHCSGDNF